VRPDVSVVIVAHGGGELVRRAIRAVEHDPAPPTREIIVVDSGRPDGPAAWLRAERPDIVLIELGENLGFGASNNRGIARSTGRYVLLLNPDAFVDEGCVGELVRFLETHPTAVAVGPRLRFGDGRLQRSCRGFPSVYRVATEYLGLRMLRRRSPALNSFYCAGFAHDEARHVDWLTGACLLVRGAPLRGAGGFDEAFFLYSEEVDLLRRLADEGGETWFDPAAGAVHLWGGVTSNDPGPAFREQLRSHVRYLHKHSGPAAAKAVRLVLLAGLVLRAPRSPGYRQALRWLAARDVDALLAGA
jgi:N-acetylglucosaminyl-diphospho-decaprenol L-rhamnosyltransferase